MPLLRTTLIVVANDHILVEITSSLMEVCLSITLHVLGWKCQFDIRIKTSYCANHNNQRTMQGDEVSTYIRNTRHVSVRVHPFSFLLELNLDGCLYYLKPFLQD